MSALDPLTSIAEVYTASHVRLFDNRATTYRAGFVNGILIESRCIPSRSATRFRAALLTIAFLLVIPPLPNLKAFQLSDRS